jgi:PAS domain S-box-containing protein
MMGWIRRSLLMRVLVGDVALSAFLLLGLTILELRTYDRELEAELHSRAESLADVLAAKSQFAMLVGDRAELERIVHNGATNPEVMSIEVIDPGGEPIRWSRGATRHASFEVSRQVQPPPGSRIGWKGVSQTLSDIGSVRLRFSSERERVTRNRVAESAAGLTLLCFLLGSAIRIMQLRAALRPLSALTAFTRRVGAGNSGGQADVAWPDEVGRLTIAFNSMLARLQVSTVSREYVDGILESIAEALLVVDAEGSIRTVNQAALHLIGCTRDELLGSTVSRICAVEVVLSAKPGTAVECLYRHAGGAMIPVLVSVAPLRASTTGFEGTVWLAQDISERKRVAEELMRAKEQAEGANAAKGRFLATMSHELRTPLNAVIGYSQLLQETCQERNLPEISSDLSRIERAGEILLDIVNEVLDYSKFEAGQVQLSAKAFTVADVVRDVIDTVAPLAVRNGNYVSVHQAVELREMHTDLACLSQLAGSAADKSF